MPDIREQIETEVNRLRTSVQQLQSLVNGDEYAVVELNNGSQPAFKKYVADKFSGIMESYRGEMDSQLVTETQKIETSLATATQSMATLQQQLDALSNQTPVTVAYVDDAVKAVSDALTVLENTVSQLPVADVSKTYVDEAILTLNTSVDALKTTVENLSGGGVEDIRLGADVYINVENRSLVSSPGHVFSQLNLDDGRVQAVWLRPLQKQIEGQWVTVSSL